MNLGQFTEPKLLVPRLLSEWRDSAISELSQRLESAQRIENATTFTHAVLDHESLVSAVFDEVAVVLTLLAESVSIEENGVRGLQGRCGEVLVVLRRKNPRPTEFPARPQRFNQDRLAVSHFQFHCDFSAFNQVEAIRRVARTEDSLARCELGVHCAIAQQLEMLLTHSLEKGLS